MDTLLLEVAFVLSVSTSTAATMAGKTTERVDETAKIYGVASGERRIRLWRSSTTYRATDFGNTRTAGTARTTR